MTTQQQLSLRLVLFFLSFSCLALVTENSFARTRDGAQCDTVQAALGFLDFAGGYKQVGSVYIWARSSSSLWDCDTPRKSEREELFALFDRHLADVRDLRARDAVDSPYCKLFVADEVNVDVIDNLREAGRHALPQLIIYVDRLQNDSRFFLECFAGGSEGVRSAESDS